MGYTLVMKESLDVVAAAIRDKGGPVEGMIFPDGFVAAIMAIETTPPAPPETVTETLALTICGGSDVTDASNNKYSNYVNVGHTSSETRKNDAVWMFTPTIDASSAVFQFHWDNSIGNVGYSAVAYDYAFYLTDVNHGEGRYAESVSGKKVESIGGNGNSGDVTVEFNGLSLFKGTTYYIRVNQNDGTLLTLKAFAKAGNTVQLTT